MFEMLPVNEDLRRPEKKRRASTGIVFTGPKIDAVAPSLDHPRLNQLKSFPLCELVAFFSDTLFI